MKCDKCRSEAVIQQRYSGMHLCAAHEILDVERKIKRRMRKERSAMPGDHIAVAMSGGKDSAVTLSILLETFGKRPDIKFSAITIDEGIEGYRNFSIPYAKELCDRYGVPHYVVSFKDEIGHTLDDVLSRDREEASCTYCGVFRRTLLNRKAREIGANKLATGHNLDDEAQAVMLNIMNGDTERLARLRPTRAQDGLIPRIKPLMDVPGAGDRTVRVSSRSSRSTWASARTPASRCAARSRTCSTSSSSGTRARNIPSWAASRT